jgi:hypothetical protein
MADATGPIRSMPGSMHRVPAGVMCDDHPDRPATHRIQGETDSMGCEMHDLCAECAAQMHAAFREGVQGFCDTCKTQSASLRPWRDWEEGSCGPVYHVCQGCRDKFHARDVAELEYMRQDDDYYD